MCKRARVALRSREVGAGSVSIHSQWARGFELSPSSHSDILPCARHKPRFSENVAGLRPATTKEDGLFCFSHPNHPLCLSFLLFFRSVFLFSFVFFVFLVISCFGLVFSGDLARRPKRAKVERGQSRISTQPKSKRAKVERALWRAPWNSGKPSATTSIRQASTWSIGSKSKSLTITFVVTIARASRHTRAAALSKAHPRRPRTPASAQRARWWPHWQEREDGGRGIQRGRRSSTRKGEEPIFDTGEFGKQVQGTLDKGTP